jgi:hypothetical protein
MADAGLLDRPDDVAADAFGDIGKHRGELFGWHGSVLLHFRRIGLGCSAVDAELRRLKCLRHLSSFVGGSGVTGRRIRRRPAGRCR